MLYHRKHRDVLEHLSANCKTIDELPIEKHNLMLRNQISPNKGNLLYEDILKASGLVVPLHSLREQLDHAFRPKKKKSKAEPVRLLEMSLAKTQQETNDRVDAFLLGLFTRPFRDPTLNEKWPRSKGVLVAGLEEMKKEITQTAKWIRKQESGVDCEDEDDLSASNGDISAGAHPMLEWLLTQPHSFLVYECKLRLQRYSGTKGILAGRILAHAEEHKANVSYSIPERVKIDELDTNKSRTRPVIPAGYSRIVPEP